MLLPQNHLIIGEITNFEGLVLASATFRFATAWPRTYDRDGRFELVQQGNKWFLAVKNGAF